MKNPSKRYSPERAATIASDAEEAASTPSRSTTNNRRPHGLSPRQRRLLQASARAKKAAAAAVSRNNDGTTIEAGQPYQNSPYSPASPPPNSVFPTYSAANTVATVGSPYEITPTELKVPLSPIHSSPASPSSVSTPTKGGGSTSKFSHQKSYYNRGSTTSGSNVGSNSGASTAVLTDDAESGITTTSVSFEDGFRQRLQLNNPTTTASTNVNGRIQSNPTMTDTVVSAEVGGKEIAQAMRGKVSSQIRTFTSMDSSQSAASPTTRISNMQSRKEQIIIGESIIHEEVSSRRGSGPLHERITTQERRYSNNGKVHQQRATPDMSYSSIQATTPKSSGKVNTPRQYRQPPRRYPTDEIGEPELFGNTKQESSMNVQRANSPHSRHIKQQSLMQQQQRPSVVSHQNQRCPSDEIVANGELRCYRIVFRGIVSLLSELDGATGNAQLTSDGNMKQATASGGSSCQHVGYGEIVATSSPEIVIPMGEGPVASRQKFVRAIRVDSILTGGFDAANSSTHSVHGMNETLNISREIAEGGGHCGYLLLSNNQNEIIAEPLPTSATSSIQSSIEHGPFIYRASSTSSSLTPVTILSGPSLDATPLGVGLLPDTVHEVSLRVLMQVAPQTDNQYGDDTMLSESDPAGEIHFLRLAQRRGWVADRCIDVVDDSKLRVSYLMQDVTNSPVQDTFNSSRSRAGMTMGGGSGIDASMSTSFDENSSLNSSAINSTADSSFYSSMNASSVTTPRAIKARRRRNRRHRSGISQQQFPPALLAHNNRAQHHRTFAGESFEEVNSSITGGNDGSTSGHDDSLLNDSSFGQNTIHQPPPTKSYYLMRVLAPLGLKILDAPQFQVSNLIHHTPPTSRRNSRTSPINYSPAGISPFARTNAMALSNSAENSPTYGSHRKRHTASSTPRVRFLPRGQIFEASARMEITGDSSLYTNGQGLIKLADGSGWAIVPHHQDLVVQFRNYYGANGDHAAAVSLAENAHELVAFEEIGNAVIPLADVGVNNSRLITTPQKPIREAVSSEQMEGDVLWFRITAPPNGIKVLLPPPQKRPKQPATTPPRRPSPSSTDHSSEVASAVSSSFFDSVWSRVTTSANTTPVKESSNVSIHSHHHRATTKHSPKQQHQHNAMLSVIPCGMVVPVEDWDLDTTSKGFVRLYNGQGWIPRHLGDATYARQLDKPPDVRVGSFWFRVKSTPGLDVRHGPSSHAPTIKSDKNVAFRFECGEYLRASEIMTVLGNSSCGADGAECYAKLYRRQNSNYTSDQASFLDRYSTLQSLTSHGEWVQVHGNGQLCLEECAEAPMIERNRHGWSYTVITEAPLHIRSGPSVQAIATGDILCNGEEFSVSERVTAGDKSACWLRLSNGLGWACSIGDDGKSAVMITDGVDAPHINQPSTQNTERSQRMVRQILERGSSR